MFRLLFFVLALTASASAQTVIPTSDDQWAPRNAARSMAVAWGDKSEQQDRARRDGLLCIQHASHQLAFTSAERPDVVRIARVGERDCTHAGPAWIALILSTPDEANGLGFEERISSIQPADQFVVILNLHGVIADHLPVQRILERMIDADAATATALPDWPHGQLSPSLPQGWRWVRGLDRTTYIDLRSGNHPIWCARSGALRMSCWTPAPSHTQAQEVFTLEGPRGPGARLSGCEFTMLVLPTAARQACRSD